MFDKIFYFKKILCFSKHYHRSWVEAMRLFLMALVLSSFMASCVDSWPMLPPMSFKNCFKNINDQGSSKDIVVPAWSVQAFKRTPFEMFSATKDPFESVRGCIAFLPASNLTAVLHIVDFNFTALKFTEAFGAINININLVVLANGYAGEVFVVLNLRQASVNTIISVDVRGLSSSARQLTLLVSNNFHLNLMNTAILRNGQLTVKRFTPATFSYQDLSWLEQWLATHHASPKHGAASYTVVPVIPGVVGMPTYVMLNISHAPVLANLKSLKRTSQYGVAETRCSATHDLLPYSGREISTLLEVMLDDFEVSSAALCRQRAWSLRSPPLPHLLSGLKRVARLRDFIILEANRGPDVFHLQLEVGAALGAEESVPLLGLTVGALVDFPEKKQNMSIVLLTDMVTRLVEIQTNSPNVTLIGRNAHLVALRQLPSLSAKQLKSKLLQKEGSYRELVRVNNGMGNTHDSNFARVLLGEKAVTVADLATQMFIQCTSTIVLLKLPMSSVQDLGLDPHRDIWIGNTHEGSHQCYLHGNGSDLYRVLSFGGTNCGARKIDKYQQMFTELWITINVGKGYNFTFSKSCSVGWNLGLIEWMSLQDHFNNEQKNVRTPQSHNLYEYTIKMYEDADLQHPYRMDNPVIDVHKSNYFTLVPKSKDVQFGVEVLDCFISWNSVPPESSGNAPAFHLIQSGCEQPWGRIQWLDQFGSNEGTVAVNRTVAFKLGNICYESSSASSFRADFMDNFPPSRHQFFHLHCRLRACSFQGIGYDTSDPVSFLPTCYANQRKVCAASILSPPLTNVYVKYGPFQIRHSNGEIESVKRGVGQLTRHIDDRISSNPPQPIGLPVWGVIGIAVLAFIMGALFIAILWYTQRRTSFRSLSTDSTSSTCSGGQNTTPQSALLKGDKLDTTCHSNVRRSYKCSECSNCSRGSSAASGSLLQPKDVGYVRQTDASANAKLVTIVPCLSQI